MESNTYTVNGLDFELQHHGVKGMKWGRRKKQSPYERATDRTQRYAEKKQKRKAIVAENLARERAALKESVNVAKLGVKVAAASAVGVAALAGIISVVGKKTPAQAASYANVGRAFIDTISVDRIPIPTIPVNRVSW